MNYTKTAEQIRDIWVERANEAAEEMKSAARSTTTYSMTRYAAASGARIAYTLAVKDIEKAFGLVPSQDSRPEKEAA